MHTLQESPNLPSGFLAQKDKEDVRGQGIQKVYGGGMGHLKDW